MKPHFKDKLRTVDLDGPWHRLTSPLRYYSREVDEVIKVPSGFVTDFASVPRLPIAYWLFGSRADYAAAVHDYLYRWDKFTRVKCDHIFAEAMAVRGYRCYSIEPMFIGVRLGGRWSYGQHLEELDPR